MELISGAYKGEHVALSQWANDWISTKSVEAWRSILTPTNVKLTADEAEQVRASVDDPHVGMFWKNWRLNDDGTFTDLRPPLARRIRRSSDEARHSSEEIG